MTRPRLAVPALVVVLALFPAGRLYGAAGPAPAGGEAGTGLLRVADPEEAAADTLRFRHGDHGAFECAACHATGRPTTRANQAWCAECHHSGAAFARCGDCHASGDLAGQRRVTRILRLSVGEPVRRVLPFDHRVHSSVACRDCHTGMPMAGAVRECGACHEDHHRPDADCTACHTDPAEDAHTTAVHTEGCGGSGCHSGPAAGYGTMQRTRSFCLSCHQEMIGHEEGEVCVTCHLLPDAEGSTDAGDRS